MSGSPASALPCFAVGEGRLGRLPGGWERSLVSPGGNRVLKQESKTLIWQLDLPNGDRSVVKMYRRRGVLSRWRGGIVPFRVQREYRALCQVADSGIRCSLPLLWGWGRAAEHGHLEVLVTSEIAGAVNLKQHLTTRGPPLRTEEWLPLFETLAKMHGRGVYHGALWPKNILLTRTTGDAWQFHLIDFARAVRFPGTICGTAMARFDLLSLLYSLGRAGAGFDAETALRGYGCGADEARTLADRARRYRSSRHLRNRLALTFQLRAAAARWLASSRG